MNNCSLDIGRHTFVGRILEGNEDNRFSIARLSRDVSGCGLSDFKGCSSFIVILERARHH